MCIPEFESDFLYTGISGVGYKKKEDEHPKKSEPVKYKYEFTQEEITDLLILMAEYHEILRKRHTEQSERVRLVRSLSLLSTSYFETEQKYEVHLFEKTTRIQQLRNKLREEWRRKERQQS